MSTVDALWTIIQSQSKTVRKALAKRLKDYEEAEAARKAQEQMLKESLNNAFDELYSNQAKSDAHTLFAK